LTDEQGPWGPSHEFIDLLHCGAPVSSYLGAEVASSKTHKGTDIINTEDT